MPLPRLIIDNPPDVAAATADELAAARVAVRRETLTIAEHLGEMVAEALSVEFEDRVGHDRNDAGDRDRP